MTPRIASLIRSTVGLRARWALACVGLASCAGPAAPDAPDSPDASADSVPAAGAVPAPEGRGGEEAREVTLGDEAILEALAKRVLTAYRARDVAALAAIGPPGASSKLVFLAPGSEQHEALFGEASWYMRAVAAWEGRILGLERGLDAAWAIFSETPPVRHAVELHRIDGRWRFYHLRQLPAPDRRGVTVIPEPASAPAAAPGGPRLGPGDGAVVGPVGTRPGDAGTGVEAAPPAAPHPSASAPGAAGPASPASASAPGLAVQASGSTPGLVAPSSGTAPAPARPATAPAAPRVEQR
jgi:hypothetical protein